VDWAAPDYRPYHALFGAEDGRVWGEATPIYLYWPNCLERIRRYDPAMKLIFLFRDPVERAWSHWKMEHGRGWETEPFSACIREGRSRVAGDPVTPGFHRIHSYVERGFYGAQLARALALFPREQMLLLRSEDLRENPDRVLEQVCAFVGVAGFGAPVRPREANVGRASGAIDGGARELVVDLTETRFLDSTALGVLGGEDSTKLLQAYPGTTAHVRVLAAE